MLGLVRVGYGMREKSKRLLQARRQLKKKGVDTWQCHLTRQRLLLVCYILAHRLAKLDDSKRPWIQYCLALDSARNLAPALHDRRKDLPRVLRGTTVPHYDQDSDHVQDPVQGSDDGPTC